MDEEKKYDYERGYDYFTVERLSDRKEFFLKTERNDNRIFSTFELAYMLSHLYPELRNIMPGEISCSTVISEKDAIARYNAQSYTAPIYGHYGVFYQRATA